MWYLLNDPSVEKEEVKEIKLGDNYLPFCWLDTDIHRVWMWQKYVNSHAN